MTQTSYYGAAASSAEAVPPQRAPRPAQSAARSKITRHPLPKGNAASSGGLVCRLIHPRRVRRARPASGRLGARALGVTGYRSRVSSTVMQKLKPHLPQQPAVGYNISSSQKKVTTFLSSVSLLVTPNTLAQRHTTCTQQGIDFPLPAGAAEGSELSCSCCSDVLCRATRWGCKSVARAWSQLSAGHPRSAASTKTVVANVSATDGCSNESKY